MLDDPTEPPLHADGTQLASLGPYRIDGVLGRGGMGEVLRGWDPALRRPVAIKRILGGRKASADARARFWREARALAALDHPGIVRVHRVDETDQGELYLAMEFIDGRSLSDFVRTPWPSALVAGLGQQVAAALGAAHTAEITHRDVKPSNLLVQADGVVRVVDFGLARRTAPEDQVTATGTRVGTPAYMAPEQIDGETIGPPTDVFALGTLLYQLLSGTHPFARETPSATAMAVVAAARRPLSEAAPLAPEPLIDVIEQCLARDPSARPADGAALAKALQACGAADPAALADFLQDHALARQESRSSPVPPSVSTAAAGQSRTLLWIAVGLMLVGGAAWWGWSTNPQPRTAEPLPPTAIAAEELPSRPVIAVLGFSAPDDDEDDPRAAIAADAARYALSFSPQIITPPYAALGGIAKPGTPVGPSILLADLTRPNGEFGHVDLAVRGTLRDVDGALEAQLELVDPFREWVVASWTVSGPSDAIELGLAIGRGIASLVDVQLPDLPLPTRSTAAYGAYLSALGAARTGDFGRFEHQLAWALQLDQNFADAQLLEFEKLRGFRQLEALATKADALRKRTDLSPRQADLARAWAAIGHQKPALALQALNGLVVREPYAVDGYQQLLALRFNDPTLVDLGEAEQVAERILAISPRHEAAASRLSRALAWRGKGAQAAERLAALGVPKDDPGFREIWGELALYLGDYDDAVAAFDAAVARSADNLYAVHMRLAALVLSEQCEQAAVSALDRIQRVESEAVEANLDWTYSLAAQAMICRRQWAPLETLLKRWEKHSESGRFQSLALRPRVALAAGVEAEAVADSIEDALESAPERVKPELLLTYARVAEDPARLSALATQAETASLAADAPGARQAWARAHRVLALRASFLKAPEGALDDYAKLVFEPVAVRREGDLVVRSQLLAIQAEAQAAAGDVEGAGETWAELAALGYPRLYATDAWVLAQEALR